MRDFKKDESWEVLKRKSQATQRGRRGNGQGSLDCSECPVGKLHCWTPAESSKIDAS